MKTIIKQIPEVLTEGILRDQGQFESSRNRSDMLYNMSRVTLTVLKIMNAGEKARITVGDFTYKASEYVVPIKLAEMAKLSVIYMNGDAVDTCEPIFQFNCDLNDFVTHNASYLRLSTVVEEQPNPNYVETDGAKTSDTAKGPSVFDAGSNKPTVLVDTGRYDVTDEVISNLLLTPEEVTKAVGKMRIRSSRVNTVQLDTTPITLSEIGYLVDTDGSVVVNTGSGDISKEASMIVNLYIPFISEHLRSYGKITKEGLERWAAEGAITE